MGGMGERGVAEKERKGNASLSTAQRNYVLVIHSIISFTYLELSITIFLRSSLILLPILREASEFII